MECIFCGNPTVTYNEYRVCKKCETISFTKEILIEEKRKIIEQYLNNVQLHILKQSEYLHHIEQAYLLKKELTSREEEIRNNMVVFQSIRTELEIYLTSRSILNTKRERELLYRLLELSPWLSKYFLEEK
jgi:hypothetical protein